MSLGEKEHRNPDSSAETPPPIQQPWARLTESVEPKFTQSQPTDELDTEIREAQAHHSCWEAPNKIYGPLAMYSPSVSGSDRHLDNPFGTVVTC
jgi:hypothetical protein